MKLLKISMICLSSLILLGCIHHVPIQFELPTREELPAPIFQKCGDEYCTSLDGVKALIKRDTIREAYEKKLINTINGCNAALK